ncbi:MAG: hypothetical protein JWL77_6847 [Chthonomonadaceae bacterium]|nr:hypothetical protein [Chthonomonadaceae bacterium]
MERQVSWCTGTVEGLDAELATVIPNHNPSGWRGAPAVVPSVAEYAQALVDAREAHRVDARAGVDVVAGGRPAAWELAVTAS